MAEHKRKTTDLTILSPFGLAAKPNRISKAKHRRKKLKNNQAMLDLTFEVMTCKVSSRPTEEKDEVERSER